MSHFGPGYQSPAPPILPHDWRTMQTGYLSAWLDNENAFRHRCYDDVLDELAERQAQAAANRGEMSGLPPQGEPS